jgi:hypothetical protein
LKRQKSKERTPSRVSEAQNEKLNLARGSRKNPHACQLADKDKGEGKECSGQKRWGAKCGRPAALILRERRWLPEKRRVRIMDPRCK